MIFHQIQLMACAALARHYARAAPSPFEPENLGAAITTGAISMIPVELYEAKRWPVDTAESFDPIVR
jgi:hypothetical protein